MSGRGHRAGGKGGGMLGGGGRREGARERGRGLWTLGGKAVQSDHTLPTG